MARIALPPTGVQREHRSFGYAQVDAVEHYLLAEGLAEALDHDR
jgi:hypothetical protein